MIQEGGSTPVMVSGGGGWGGEGWGGGIMGIILVIALLGGGLGGFGFGRGRDGRDGGHCDGGYHAFALQKDVLENRFVSEKNTLQIIQNQDAGFCKILDKMSCIEMQNLRDKISGLETALSEQRITATILTNLQPPRAVPSYPAPNPYVPFPPPNYGYGHGCSPCGA